MRHGEVKNINNIIYGRLPGFSLSEKGRQQVKKSGLILKGQKVAILYSSPLLRARQSARILSKILKLKPNTSYLITEIRNIFQGIPIKEYKSKIQPFQFDEKYIKKGQESISEISVRMLKFIKHINKLHKGKIILAVSHGDPIVILKSVFEKKQFTWKYKIDNYLDTAGFIKLQIGQ